jgi:PAS domain S-box-containing protein
MDEDVAIKSIFLENKLVDALFDGDREILILTTGEMEIVKINLAASIHFGIPKEEFVGGQLESLLDPNDRAWIKSIMTELRIDGETINTDFTITDYLGNRQRWPTRIRHIRCEGDEPHYFLFAIQKAQGQISKHLGDLDSDKLIQRLLKGISDSVLLIDMASRTICDCNLASEFMFGYSRSELIGRGPQFLTPDSGFARSYSTRGGEGHAKMGFSQDRALCRRKDGSLFMTLATNFELSSHSGDHDYVLSIHRDLTQEEMQYENIYRISKQLIQQAQALNDAIAPLREQAPHRSLSDIGFNGRQIDIATILVTGETTKVIAAKLKVSESAIKNHLTIMYHRLGVSSRMEFVKFVHDNQIRLE